MKTVMDNEEFMAPFYNSTTDSGIVGVSWFYAGTRSFYSKNPINSPDDLKGKKIRVMSSETNVKMAEALGGAGVVMAYSEVYTGLQQGVIDVAESPQIALVSHKHGEVAKYYANDEHQIIPGYGGSKHRSDELHQRRGQAGIRRGIQDDVPEGERVLG